MNRTEKIGFFIEKVYFALKIENIIKNAFIEKLFEDKKLHLNNALI
jgi:hypothetical protein